MSKSKKNDEQTESEFSLKSVELQMVQNMHNRANQSLFDFFSFVALERLAYTVTENTRFRVDQGKLYISEVEPQSEMPTKDEVAVA